jgi:hypothetical protein
LLGDGGQVVAQGAEPWQFELRRQFEQRVKDESALVQPRMRHLQVRLIALEFAQRQEIKV